MAAVHILQPRRTPAGVGIVLVLAAIITAGWTPSAFAQPGLAATLGLGLNSLAALPADVADGRHTATVSVEAEHLGLGTSIVY